MTNAIAVIGMSGRFPSAPSIERLWEQLCNGVELTTFFDADVLAKAGVPRSVLERSDYVRAKPVLDDIEGFDAELFRISPREAALTDPQHRLFLECAWEALEDAGHDPWSHPGRIGIFASAGKNTYLLFHLLSQQDWTMSDEVFQLLIGNEKDYLTTRVSHQLNLTGPSMSVQTACSSSLVAVHLACQSLLLGECDIALAGGVSVDVPREAGYVYRPGGILSPDGRCRSFDAAGAGTLFGHGLGIVVLRRASDALADGDSIRALVRGSAVNNDGANRAGFTAPSIEGQASVIAEALAVAEIAPDAIGFVEGHGTATHVGDAVEIEALRRVFRDRQSPVILGALKSNAGHMNAAAGIGSFIKAVLAVERGVIPPTLHFTTPHPLLQQHANVLTVNRERMTWNSNAPRLAGVSSFGQGGTNAHVIVEQPPAVPPRETDGAWHLLPLSARTPAALASLRERIERAVHGSRLRAEDVAYTLQVGRRPLATRGALFMRGTVITEDATYVDEELRNIAAKWIGGATIDWPRGTASRISLPTYPFEHKRHWIDASPQSVPERVTQESKPADSVEETIARVFGELLGIDVIGSDDDFFLLGGHSLLEPGLRSRLDALGFDVSQGVLWENPTPAALARHIRSNARSRADDEAAAIAELRLDDAIRAGGPASSDENEILLTGVTGLLGAHLLAELLQRTNARVHCLLRAESPEHALARIRETLRTYALPEGDLDSRVVAVPADLARPRLGLSELAFDRLAQTIDRIYHAGASVNFVQPYRALKPTNVDGVHEMLRFASQARVKPLHYVSSIAVFESDSFADATFVREDQDIASSSGFHNGYDISKWAAERLVLMARERGLPVSVYRLSNITGHSETGIVLPQHIFACLIKGCVQLECAPGEDDVVNLVPVDHAATAIVALSRAHEAAGMNFHVVNPEQTRVQTLVDWLRRRGFRLDTIPYDDWRQRLRAAPLDNSFKPFLGLIEQGRLFTNRLYDTSNARRFTASLDRARIDERLLDRYLDYWKRTSYLGRG